MFKHTLIGFLCLFAVVIYSGQLVGKQLTEQHKVALYPFTVISNSLAELQNRAQADSLYEQLLNRLANNNGIELLDRSMVISIFQEKALNASLGNQALDKLPLSNYSVTGLLLSSSQQLSLKIVDNSNGRILSNQLFDLKQSAASAALLNKMSAFILSHLQQAKNGPPSQRRLAIGNIINRSDSDDAITGADQFRVHLLELLSKQTNFSLHARAESYPLLFEQHLKTFQYSDNSSRTKKPAATHLISGEYYFDKKNLDMPIQFQLNINRIGVIQKRLFFRADSWLSLATYVSNTLIKLLAKPVNTTISTESLFRAGLMQAGLTDKEIGLSKTMNLSASDRWKEKSQPDLTQAIILFQKVLHLNPEHVGARMALANSLSHPHIGKLYEASTQYEKVLLLSTEGFVHDMARHSLKFMPLSADLFSALGHNSQQIYDDLLASDYITHDGKISNKAKQLKWQRKLVQLEGYSTLVIKEITTRLTQSRYNVSYNPEAQIHFEWAVELAGIKQESKQLLPRITLQTDKTPTSTIQYLINLRQAADAFSSALYLNNDDQKTRLYLAFILEQPEINMSSHARLLYRDVIEKTNDDHLKFIAADRLDVVTNTTFSPLFKSTLNSSEYFIKQLETLSDKDEHSAKSLLSMLMREIIDNCRQLEERNLKIRRLKIDKRFTKLSQKSGKNKELQLQRLQILDEMRRLCPSIYPLYATTMRANSPHLIEKQLELISDVESGQQKLILTNQFIKQVNQIIDKLLKKRDINLAKRYFSRLEPLLQRDLWRAPYIAYLHAVMGAPKKGIAVMERENLTQIIIRAFQPSEINGRYQLSKINKQGVILFQNELNRSATLQLSFRSALIYGSWILKNDSVHYSNTLHLRHPFKQMDNKWRKASARYVRNGVIRWETRKNVSSDCDSTKCDPPLQKGKNLLTENNEIRKRFIKPMVGNTPPGSCRPNQKLKPIINNQLIQALWPCASIDIDGDYAIVGMRWLTDVGPVNKEDFKKSTFEGKQDIDLLLEALFKKGYLDINYRLSIKHQDLRRLLKKDFPAFTQSELSSLQRTLEKSLKIKRTGAAFIYQRRGDNWHLQQKLLANDAKEELYFGSDVAITNGHALVCSSGSATTYKVITGGEVVVDKQGAKSAVYHFKKVDGRWSEQSKLSSEGCRAIDVDHNWAVVAGFGGSRLGQVETFLYSNDRWNKTGKLAPQGVTRGQDSMLSYGTSVDISDNYIAVGNPNEMQENLYGAGAAYIFNRQNNTWSQQTRITADKGAILLGQFGQTVAVSKNRLLVAAPELDGSNKGSRVFLFAQTSNIWKMREVIQSDKQIKHKEFGRALILDGSQAFVGSRGNAKSKWLNYQFFIEPQ